MLNWNRIDYSMKMKETSRVWDKKLIDNNNLDYYNNKDNEGHIMVPMLNLSPFDVIIKKGDKIAQALIKNYYTIDNEEMNQTQRSGGFGSTDKVSDN